MDSALRSGLQSLLDSSDTLAAFEMMWAAVLDGVQSAPSFSCAARLVGDALNFCEAAMSTHACHLLHHTTAADIVSLFDRSSALDSLPASLPECRVDPREVATATLSAGSSMLQAGGFRQEDDSGEGIGDGEGVRKSRDAVLVCLPLVVRVMRRALPLLWMTSIRRLLRSSSVASAAASLPAQSLSSVLAWMQQMLTFLQNATLLASQKDGEVEYVSVDPTSHDDLHSKSPAASPADVGAAEALHQHSTTFMTPLAVATVVFCSSPLSLVSELSGLIEDCVTILEFAARNCLCDQSTSLNTAASRCRQQLLLSQCCVRWLTTNARMYAEVCPGISVSRNADGSANRSILTTSRLLRRDDHEEPSLCDLIQTLSEAALRHQVHANKVSQEQKSRREANELRRHDRLMKDVFSYDSAMTQGLHSDATNAAIPFSFDAIEKRLLALCLDDTKQAVQFLRRQGSSPGTTVPSASKQEETGCEASNAVGYFLDLVTLWSRVIAETEVQAAATSRSGMQPQCPASVGPCRTASSLARRLRDDALYGGAGGCGGDSHDSMARQIQRCGDLEAKLKPLLLLSSDDDEDNMDLEESPDNSEGPACPAGWLLTSDLGRVHLSGAVEILLAALSATGADQLNTGKDAHRRLPFSFISGARSSHRVVEACIPVVRLFFQSKSLAACAFGLRLWTALLVEGTLRYTMDCPGEVLRKATNEDAASDASDLVDLVTLHSGDTTTTTSEVYRTTRFGAHYYLFQALASVVVMNPSKLHRIAAQHVLHRTLSWYVAPLRCKLLCALMVSSPYPAISVAMMTLLKDEIRDAYEEALAALEQGAEDATDSHRYLQCGSAPWFLVHLPEVLTCVLRLAQRWTQSIVPAELLDTNANPKRPPQSVISSTKTSECVECVTSAFNFMRHIFALETRWCAHDLAKLGSVTSLRGVVFSCSVPAAGEPAAVPLKIAKPPAVHCSTSGSSRAAFRDPGSMLMELDHTVLRPWHALATRVFNGESEPSAPVDAGVPLTCHVTVAANCGPRATMSPVEAFSVLSLIEGIWGCWEANT